MRVELVLVDMDDVLVNFSAGACAIHQADYNAVRNAQREMRSWSMVKPLAKCLGRPQFNLADFWHPIDTKGAEFWVNLREHEWFSPMVEMLDGMAVPWAICSSPANHKGCYIGKAAWVADRLLDTRMARGPIPFMLLKDKYRLANERTLLIDDSDRNAKLFEERGGSTILFPQVYNDHQEFSDDPLVYVKEQLNLIGALK